MDAARQTKGRPPEREGRSVDADLLPVAAPEADIAVAYAAWRLDRSGDKR